jgi:hypothetical protein
MRKYSSEELRVLLRFFDHEQLRMYYTGLIADLRSELHRRGELDPARAAIGCA